jgi:PIN domain nuclease of toxin-antitoxin system
LIHVDTHVAAWLYAGLLEPFGPRSRALLAGEDIVVSPMVELELQYLYEIGKIGEEGRTVVEGLSAKVGLRVCDLPFPQVVSRALAQSWTRDPFDRLIVAQADLADAVLLTKDRTIRQHYPRAFWDPGDPLVG